MNYSGIIYDDIANGPGIRTSLFVSGCRNNCPGCFNKEQQDFNYGKEFTHETVENIIDSICDAYHDGITILGGDPMEPENAAWVATLISEFRRILGSNKTIWVYTGYKYEDLINNSNSNIRYIMNHCDVLVDGPFILAQKDIRLKFKGSSNQRIIDMKATLRDKCHDPVVIG